MLRTAVIGVGSLGRQHARIHAALAAEGTSQFVAVCDLNEQTARSISSERETDWTTNWRDLIGRIDAASVAVPTEAHCEIACGLLEAGIQDRKSTRLNSSHVEISYAVFCLKKKKHKKNK